MINVNVFSEEKAWSKRLKNKDLFFKKVCKAFPKKYKFSNKKVSFTLLLSNNKNIKKLNKVFRNKNKSTDILSFPLNKKIKISKITYLGDIIISYNYLDKPKSQNLKLFEEKVIKIFIHGFLHLLGFDHKKNKDYSKMLREEIFLFKSVKLKIN
jgi:probable rRNA maturation factor